MRIGEWEARFERRFDRMDVALYMSRMTSDGREVLLRNGKTKLLKEGLASRDQDLAFARFESDEQVQALGTAMAAFGVKTDSDHRLAGVLQAQTEHLADMRRLVFNRRLRSKK